MQVPLLDLKAQYQTIKDEIQPAVLDLFEKQMFVLGPAVQACEASIADYCGCGYACGVTSGTDALLISLMAECIGPGDEVITSPYTFFATAGSIWRTGAKPVFVDILPDTFNINPALIEEKITDRTRAIMPVHLYGQMADMDEIMKIAEKHDLVVIEDAAQAIGATYKGRAAGSISHYGCFSFFPSKNLGGAGDGGMVVTNSRQRAEKLQILRNHGMEPKYYHKLIGGNFRLDAIQAAVISVKLRHLNEWAEGRRANADRYQKLFQDAGSLDDEKVTLPPRVLEGHVFNQYVIRAGRRDELMQYLKNAQIGCDIYYPVPLHLQECFEPLGYRTGDLPESEKAAAETLALPVYAELSNEQAEYVVETISSFYRS
ncbi:MAG: DegT/DnrJ/EryC1/StrS family aminotransferase [Verrucomicrobia bacterium]|nr:DegT/DnrJ/EryC1/StrS family aminotransferase [Verrucomicrobiota bacterium]